MSTRRLTSRALAGLLLLQSLGAFLLSVGLIGAGLELW